MKTTKIFNSSALANTPVFVVKDNKTFVIITYGS